MTALVCWNCGENLDDLPRPISRQASCPKCFNDVHCCRLCVHYDRNSTTTCFEDRADTPLQKENANFCEFFAPRDGAFETKTAVESTAARDELGALFQGTAADTTNREPDSQVADEAGNEPLSKEQQAKKKLDDLFG